MIQTFIQSLQSYFVTIFVIIKDCDVNNKFKEHDKKFYITGTSLVVQWLRYHLAMQWVHIQSLVGEIRSHMPRGQKTKPENRNNTVTNKDC